MVQGGDFVNVSTWIFNMKWELVLSIFLNQTHLKYCEAFQIFFFCINCESFIAHTSNCLLKYLPLP